MTFKLSIQGNSIAELASAIASLNAQLNNSGSIEAANKIAAHSLNPLNTEDGEDAGNALDVSGQTDAEGLPWDGRIHSSNKKKTAKGVWVARRGVADDVYEKVAAELRGATAPVQPAFPSMPSMDTGFTAPVMGYGGSAAVQFNPVASVAPVMPPVSTQPTITDLFNKVQSLFATGNADQNYINSITHRLSQQFQLQVNAINDIAGRPDMIAYAMQLFTVDGK